MKKPLSIKDFLVLNSDTSKQTKVCILRPSAFRFRDNKFKVYNLNYFSCILHVSLSINFRYYHIEQIMNEQQLLVRLNPIGYKIKKNMVGKILNFKSDEFKIERENIASFFQFHYSELSHQLLERYAKACNTMTNISIGPAHPEIYNKLIVPLASAKRCYCYNEELACIELCALGAEMLAIFLCITHHLFDNIIELDKQNQRNRINKLLENKIITKKQQDNLISIHDTRIKFFHHWSSSNDNLNQESLSMLRKLSKELAAKIEILDNTENYLLIKNNLSQFH
jgi:hypothetical protein